MKLPFLIYYMNVLCIYLLQFYGQGFIFKYEVI